MEHTWTSDILGQGYEQLTIPLGHDNEGEIVCTLVTYRQTQNTHNLIQNKNHTIKPKFALLYIHGWNDYFFQKELAEKITSFGGTFYAVDLQKYGRSLRPNQSFAYIDDLKKYDNDINACLKIIENEQGKIPTIIMGHSTGGLIASLWANRNPNKLDGLILNSPWLELQIGTHKRPFYYALASILSKINPKITLTPSGPNNYGHSLKGWHESDGPLPPHLSKYPNDPSVIGFGINEKWKVLDSTPIYIGWLKAILSGHYEVAKGMDIQCPIYLGCSTSWNFSKKWDINMRRSDTVLNTDLILKRAKTLGKNVTIDQFDGKHDLVLSDPQVRQEFYEKVERWIQTFMK